MTKLRISREVRQALTDATADSLLAGVGLPPDAQCWRCGNAINLFALLKPVTVSVVYIGYPGGGSVCIPLFAHRACTVSRVVSAEQFEREASKRPSPVSSYDPDPVLMPDGSLMLPNLIVEGEPVRVVGRG